MTDCAWLALYAASVGLLVGVLACDGVYKHRQWVDENIKKIKP